MFRHATAEKATLYRSIMEVFAAAKRQYRLQLRPDEVLSEANWGNRTPPAQEEIAAALAQLAAWGNLESQPDMTRVSTLNDYYRARFLYRLSRGGEAVEASLIAYAQPPSPCRTADSRTGGHRQPLTSLAAIDG